MLTANNPANNKFNGGENWQDFLLVIYITRAQVRFCTYTMGATGLDEGK